MGKGVPILQKTINPRKTICRKHMGHRKAEKKTARTSLLSKRGKEKKGPCKKHKKEKKTENQERDAIERNAIG